MQFNHMVKKVICSVNNKRKEKEGKKEKGKKEREKDRLTQDKKSDGLIVMSYAVVHFTPVVPRVFTLTLIYYMP